MCGRFASAKHDVDLVPEIGVQSVIDLPPDLSWNVAPTDPARVVIERKVSDDPLVPPQRQLRSLRWGLIPSWAKDAKIASRLINARVETLAEKPAFKAAMAKRRCLVPASGYFEWEQRASESRKVPTYLHRHGETLWFAGLYEIWRNETLPETEPLVWTFTILTTRASDEVGHIHNRSPILIPPDLRDDWLHPQLTNVDRVRALLDATPDPKLAVHEVSAAVNSVRNNGPELIDPI